MIQKKRAILHYAPCDNDISLCAGEFFLATINKLRDHDLKRLWFLYTKNQPSSPSETPIQIEVSTLTKPGHVIKGTVLYEIMTSDVQWLSFGGDPFNEAVRYTVLIDNAEPFEVNNAHNKESLQPLLPFFKHHGKHPEKAYHDRQRNEEVAGMPIRDEKVAGDLLRIGIEHDKNIYSYHSNGNQFYCFKRTGSNVYHGYAIREDEVPISLLTTLKN
jgi:hypothetical protein